MRIACPTCDAAYDVPDRLIGAAGRQLRCAKCGHAWLVLPAEAAPGASGASPTASPPPASPPPASLGVANPPPFPPAFDPLASPNRDMPPPLSVPRRSPQVIDPPLPQHDDEPPRPAIELWVAWAASILLVVLAGTALWFFRADIVAVWPPMARLYLALGIEMGG